MKLLRHRSTLFAAALSAAWFLASCTQIQRPAFEPFIAVTPPPPKQEFRWSNGKLPRSFDPAKAGAAPETDVVKAIFEGLTDISDNGEAVPAAAEKWASSEDKRTWTFTLRRDARWSNGKRVTTADFVSSWKRLQMLGDKTAHRELLRNIVGMKASPADATVADTVQGQIDSDLGVLHALRFQQATPTATPKDAPATKKGSAAPMFGVEAPSDTVLKVTLELPDKDFAKLVASPIFRPVYGDGAEFDTDALNADVVTNGPFRVTGVDKNGISLERSGTYWNRDDVGLEYVRLVPTDSAEAALEAYKRGELDAVSNADFEPLAVKLLSPYQDLKRSRHGALNFYEFNTRNYPFTDRRVREALAISIDRQRLADVEMEGSTEPATSFLPTSDRSRVLNLDVEKARDLLEKAGFPNGDEFPPIRLVVNRNDTQQRIARAVARMWKQDLNLETSIIVKEAGEMESTRLEGQYDLMRRGVVLPARDDMVSLSAIVGNVARSVPVVPSAKDSDRGGPSAETESSGAEPPMTVVVLTEDDVLFEMNAIPLYFPVSYSLVKPYVGGFEIDGSGSPDLKKVSIDSSWQPKAAN